MSILLLPCKLTYVIVGCREQSGPIIAFSITVGLTVGSILAVLLTSLLQSR